MLQLPMVIMLHTIENTANSRLGSSDMTAGKLVPVENLQATKWIKSYVLQSIIKEVFALVK